MPTLPTNPHAIGDSGHVNDHNTIVTALTLLPPIGAVTAYAGTSAPDSWLFCFGQAISRTTYASLFAALGTGYGVGDGTSTFNLPDLRGRTIAGFDNMGGTDSGRLDWANTPGTSGGAQTHTLSAAESGVPAHQHANTLGAESAHTHSAGFSVSAYIPGNAGLGTANYMWATGGINGFTTGAGSSHNHTITNVNNTTAAAANAHNNMQPTLLLNWIIRAT